MKGSPEKILTFLKLSDCLLTVEHGQKIKSYNLSHIQYPTPHDVFIEGYVDADDGEDGVILKI